ncbi:hypothetical protein C7S20_08635 [Christiangramia fulva]|uniref:Adenylosuccinate synthetase n=1 Tax=Christiangramia fulva TaxID=2126553 RepID=A0A2R3ZAX4_9FLAO|nr:hypothetical protein [Christiangramia fulva]AVR47390.1 hypothetical protein C7S20_08635 [Christiangramia fulva]
MKKSVLLFLLITLFFLMPSLADAQCAMCRAVLQNEANQSAAKGINDGILYLMIFPYILVGGVGYFVYRSRRKKKNSF